MSAKPRDKSEIAAALAKLGLTKSQVLAAYGDDDTSTSSRLGNATLSTLSNSPQPGARDPQLQPATSFQPPHEHPSTHQQHGIHFQLPVPAASHLPSAIGHGSATVSTHPPSTNVGITHQASPLFGAGDVFGRAAEYYGAQSAASSSGGGMSALRSLASQPTPPPINTIPAMSASRPFGLPTESHGQWGSSGTTTHMPTHVPSALTTILAPSYVPARSAVAPSGRSNNTPSSNPRPTPNRAINNIDRVVVIPSPLYERNYSQLAYACQRAGLSRTIELQTGFTREMVHQTLKTVFQGVIDFDAYSFEWMFLTQSGGDRLMEANIPYLATGVEIAKAYKKKSVVFLRLHTSAVPALPLFIKHIQARCEESRKSAARLLNDPDLLLEGETMEDVSSEDEPQEFKCGDCGGTFLASARSAHENKCVGPRKRTASARHESAAATATDPISSPERTHRPMKRSKASTPKQPSCPPSRPSTRSMTQTRAATPANLTDSEGNVPQGMSPSESDDEPDDNVTLPPVTKSSTLVGKDTDDDEDNDDLYEEEEPIFGTHASSGTMTDSTSQPHPPLCPLCDEALPEGLSSAFYSTLAYALRFAEPQPSPSNPGHYELEWTRTVGICSIHRAHAASAASRALWPTSIDFERLQLRLMKHCGHLLDVLGGTSTNHTILEDFRSGDRSIATTSARISALDYTHAGYYGPKGYQLICHHLIDMFISCETNVSSILSFVDFVHYVLAPYASFLLIGEDFYASSKSPEEIWEFWKDSKAHGEAFYPEE